MKELSLEFGVENNAAEFLGANINCCEDKSKLAQSGHINSTIVALGLQYANFSKVPASKEALGHDLDSEPFSTKFIYA
eukprot:11449102-Ditylum_brightwellii.AAC.1